VHNLQTCLWFITITNLTFQSTAIHKPLPNRNLKIFAIEFMLSPCFYGISRNSSSWLYRFIWVVYFIYKSSINSDSFGGKSYWTEDPINESLCNHRKTGANTGKGGRTCICGVISELALFERLKTAHASDGDATSVDIQKLPQKVTDSSKILRNADVRMCVTGSHRVCVLNGSHTRSLRSLPVATVTS
jgi:hypothetical protein